MYAIRSYYDPGTPGGLEQGEGADDIGLNELRRAFEINSKAIRTAEQMMELANNIKR